MNITTGFGTVTPTQLSENKGNQETTTFIALNPLSASVEVTGLVKELNFDLPSLLNNSGEDQSEQPDLNQPAISPLLLNDAPASAPIMNATGDKAQALLMHLLNAEETVSLAPAIQRTAAEMLPIENGASSLSLAESALSRTVNNFQAPAITTALVKESDRPMPVKPLFFAQALLNDEVASDKSAPELTGKTFSSAIKSLSETGEGVKSIVNQHSVQTAGTQNSGNNGQLNWSPVKLRGSQEQMSEQLHSVLRERLQIQTDGKVQQATIRLDPPSMGKIDIALHIEAGKLNIQINAAQTDVYRALQQMSNELRQSLTEQNFLQVNVQVSSDSSRQGHQDGRREAFENDSILTAQDIAASSTVDSKDGSILTTV